MLEIVSSGKLLEEGCIISLVLWHLDFVVPKFLNIEGILD
jgi:hypothetical protein